MLLLAAIQTIIFLVTAIFIAIQTRKISNTLRLSMHQATLDNLHRLDELLITDDELAEVFEDRSEVAGASDSSSVWKPKPKHRTFLYFVFNLIDSLYNRFRLGIVDYHTWLPWKSWLTSILRKRHVSEFWKSVHDKRVFSQRFSDYVDHLLTSLQEQDECAIVIPFRDSEQQLRQCLDALHSHVPSEWKVCVVCDGIPRSEIQGLLSDYEWATFDFIPASGPAVARNRGLYSLRAEFIFFVDSDVTVEANSLQLMRDVLRERPALGGVQAVPIAREPSNSISRYEEAEYWLSYVQATDPILMTDQLHTHCVAYRRDVLIDIGGFDERFISPGGEDTDLSFTVEESGFQLAVATQAHVQHANPETLRGYMVKRINRIAARSRLYRKHPTKMLTDRCILSSGLTTTVLVLSVYYLSPVPILTLLLFKLLRFMYVFRRLDYSRSSSVICLGLSTIRDLLYSAFPLVYLKQLVTRRGFMGNVM